MEQFLTPRELADYLAVSTVTLARWRREDRPDLPFTKLGRQIRYKQSDVVAFVKSHQKVA